VNIMIGNIEHRKVRRQDIVPWIEIGWEKVKVATKIGHGPRLGLR
jgi:hypothetical protein